MYLTLHYFVTELSSQMAAVWSTQLKM